MCDKWQSESKSLKDITNYRIADVQSKRMEMSFMKLAREFCEKEKSNNTKSQLEFTDQNVRFVAYFHVFPLFFFAIFNIVLIFQDVEKSDLVDWFDVIPSLTSIPKTSNMASKLCIQLHSFPKDVFESIQKTQIVTGQDSAILSKLEVELRLLVSSIADNFVCTM